MKRRTFLHLSSLSVLSTGFSHSLDWIGEGMSPETRAQRISVPASWRILDNGAFDIFAGDISIIGCYPAIGENTFHPEQVRVKRFSGV